MSEDVKIKKASEVLFDLDRKVNALMEMVRSLDLNIKTISNKLNLLSKSGQVNQVVSAPKFVAETDTISIPFSNKDVEFVQASPIVEDNFGDLGRRGGRNDISHKSQPKPAKDITPEVLVPTYKKEVAFVDYVDTTPVNSDTLIPVFQKVQNDDGKSIFLAEVVIKNIKTNKIEKTRTNGAGKWSHSLPIGKYEITISKKLPNLKEKKEIKQTIIIDSSRIPFEIEAIRIV